jgi:hypothetical protein
MKTLPIIAAASLLAVACCVCGCSKAWPKTAQPAPEPINLWPDYTGLIIPYNLAPLNCTLKNSADSVRYRLASADGATSYIGSGHTVSFPLETWRCILTASQGTYVTLEVALQRKGEWFTLQTVTNNVSADPVDPALVYRLIPPSYERFQTLRICQRDLTSFNERLLLSNMQVSREQCINCHTFKQYDGRSFAFHTRLHKGGTVIFRHDKKPIKVDMKCGPLYSSGSYPAWHPVDENLFAFSVNKTRQAFYMTHNNKIEVLDSQSGLILYDAAKNEVSPIYLHDHHFPTFPTWAPDGKTLYFTMAEMEGLPPVSDETNRLSEITIQSTNMFYHLACCSFNSATRQFGRPQLLINGIQSRASISFPRVSPDGVYLMMTVLAYANFPIWHKESDLWLYNIKTKESRAMTEVNSADAESYHAWGSNGKWFVFGSRREDGIHTRPYLAHFNPKTGRASKPFLVPQKNPNFYKETFISFNRPELLKIPVPYSSEEIRQAVLQPTVKSHFR